MYIVFNVVFYRFFFYLFLEHKFVLDAEKMNRETTERDRSLWDALESSKWLPIEQLEVF